MKKRNSVTMFIISVLALGIISYSAVIFVIVRANLNKGLVKYFDDEVLDQTEVLEDEMRYSLTQTMDVARFIQHSYEAIFPEYGFDRSLMNSFAEGAQMYHGAKNIVFFNSFGMQVSSPKYGSVPKTNELKEVIKGKEVSKLEKIGSDIYATVMLPLKSDGRYFGAVEISSPITTDELVSTVKKYTNCDVTIFNENERYLSTIDGTQGTTYDDPKVFESVMNNQPKLVQEQISGQKFISYYFPFHDDAGNFFTTLFMGKKFDVATNLANQIFTPLIGVIVFFTILFIAGFTVLIYFKMIRPLKQVRKAIANLSSGDADLTMRLPTESKDEYAALSEEVNKFIEMLHGIIADLTSSQGVLVQASDNLGDNAQNSASATAQILANIESVRKQSQNQADAVQNTSSVLDMSASSVDVLSRLIEDQNSSVTESSAAIEEMLGNISAVTTSVKKMSTSFDELGTTVDEGKTKLGSVDQKVNQIAEQSKMLVQANAVISQIASETNLLAMNAAIEAAHAGESGKGFSVVAEEIRKLAENSSVQSKNISSELKGISTSIQDVVTLSHESQTAFGAIVDQLGSTDMIIREITNAMEEQQTASKQVFESLSSMKDQSGEVSNKAADMSKGIADVARDMNTVSQISSTILGSMDEMTVGMQQIGGSTQNVSDLANQTKQNISAMKTKLDRFKI